MKPQHYAARTTYRPPAAWYRRLNRLGVTLTSAGVAPRDAVTLEVVGRTSGRIRKLPLLRTSLDGQDYLVALAGESQWVRNVRAADGRAVIRRRRGQPVRLVELPEAERPAVIAAYLRKDPSTPRGDGQQAEHYFGLPPSPTIEDIRPIAGWYPVFRIEYEAGAPTPEARATASPDGRPVTVTAAAGALGFVGVTALGGGIEMWLFPHGNRYVEPEWLDVLPVTTWRLPGTVLAGVFGIGSLVTARGLVSRSPWPATGRLEDRTGRHWSWAACLALGVGLEAWIATEIALLPERSPIEALYAAVGAALIGLPLTPSARRYLTVAAHDPGGGPADDLRSASA